MPAWDEVGALAGVVSVVAVAVGYVARSSGGWWKRKSTEDHAAKTQADYLFGKPADDKARTPAQTGWIAKVDGRFDRVNQRFDAQDEQLRTLIRGQRAATEKLTTIVNEVTPDENGGDNLRGSADRAAGKHD